MYCGLFTKDNCANRVETPRLKCLHVVESKYQGFREFHITISILGEIIYQRAQVNLVSGGLPEEITVFFTPLNH